MREMEDHVLLVRTRRHQTRFLEDPKSMYDGRGDRARADSNHSASG